MTTPTSSTVPYSLFSFIIEDQGQSNNEKQEANQIGKIYATTNWEGDEGNVTTIH